MASLANQTISSTYDGLIKTSTDQPVGVSGVQLLEDGVGNSLALSVGRANQGVTVTGTLTATSISGVLADGVTATTQATSDNSTKVATTAFVKSVVTAEDLDIAGDSGTGAVDLDSQTLTIAGTANEIETVASGQTVTIGLPSSVTVGTLNATTLGGTLSTAAQPNITSVGTLSSLTVSGNVNIDSNTLFVDSSANQVGINTNTPSREFEVTGAGNVYLKVSAQTDNDAAALELANTQETWTIINQDLNDDALEFSGSTNGTALTIKKDGNVGIGTTPASTVALDIKESTVGADLILGLTAGTGARSQIRSFAQAGSTTSELGFYTVSGNTYERMRISSTGNVGIGTSSPAFPLHVTSSTDIVQFESTTNGLFNQYKSTVGIFGYVGSGSQTVSGGGTTDFGIQAPLGSMLFAAGGNIERMRIDSSGNVGIGTDNPFAKTHIKTGTSGFIGSLNTNYDDLAVEGSGNTGITILTQNANNGGIAFGDEDNPNAGIILYAHSDDSLRSYVNGSERMRIDSSGNVGIGTSSTFGKLSINSDGAPATANNMTKGLTVHNNAFGRAINMGVYDAGGYSYIQSAYVNSAATAVDLAFLTGATERMRITSGGEVLVAGLTDNTPNGEAATGQLVSYSDGAKYGILVAANSTSPRAMIAFSNPNGVVGEIVSSGSSTAYNTSSDYRLKENVVEMTGALDRVDALKPSRFNFIADPEKIVDGFLAHEVQAIVPEAVTGEKDAVDEEGNPVYQGIDQSKIVPLLVGAIKELKAEIETLKAQING